MHSSPIIDLQAIRDLMPTIMNTFEGIELKALGNDGEENVALASSITLLLIRQMKGNGKNYLPTAIDFVKRVPFPGKESESEPQTIPQVDQDIIENYIRDISEPSARVALAIQTKVTQYQDAHFILSMLYFSMLILSSTVNFSTAKLLLISLLESN